MALLISVSAGVAFLTLLPAMAQLPLDCDSLLGSDQDGNLFSIDVKTGASALIGTMPEGMTEIEYDNLTDTLYADGAGGSSTLFSIDPATGAAQGAVRLQLTRLPVRCMGLRQETVLPIW